MKALCKRRVISLLLALALAVSLAVPASATDDGEGEGGTDLPTGITLTPDTLTMTVGNSRALPAVSYVPSGTTGEIEWTISGTPGVVRIENDRITALSAGTTRITATVKGTQATQDCEITVEEAPTSVTGITLTPSSVSLEAGRTQQLSVTYAPVDATNQTVTWSSDAPSVAEVSNSGLVTAKSAGTAVITATSADGPSATCTVTVTAPPQAPTITLDKKSAAMTLGGDKVTLTATVTPSTTSVQWSIDKETVVVFDAAPGNRTQATLRAVGAGDARVTIRDASGTVSDFCSVRVTAPDPDTVTGVKITPLTGPNYLDTNATLDLTATVTPSTAAATLSWSSSNNAVATVDSTGRVKGVAPGEVTITVMTPTGFKDSIDLQVSGVTLDKTTLSVFVNKSETLVYHLFGSVRTATPAWTSVNPSIADTSPAGRVTGHYPGTTDVTITAGKYKATCTVTVSEDLAAAIERNLGTDGYYPFTGLLSELNQRSEEKTGKSLSYVYGMEVSTKNGVLYYGFVSPDTPGHGVGASERYYYQDTGNGRMPLRDITFVPKSDFVGTAVIDYTGVNTDGVPFIGTIRISVSSTGDVTYSTAVDRPVAFSAGDFSAVCQNKNGKAVGYITFDQPAASRGTLYYNYSSTGQYSQKVDSNTRYYPSSNPNINLITFVPAEGYTGTLDVTYRCTDSSGSSYTGRVSITVYSPSGSTNNDVEYHTGLNQRFTLDASDFNDASRRVTSAALNYIRFESLPASSYGALYYNYSSSSSTRVSAGTRYYRSSSPRISYITFVPANGYSGTLTIPFTGYNVSGNTFTGNLVIYVNDERGTVNYATDANQAVTFNAADFNNACQRSNGTALNRLSFTALPSSGSGTLYYSYNNYNNVGTRVTTSDTYYRSGSPALSSVTFVPASNYNGTVTIPFSGYDASGGRFSGTVVITVGRGYSDEVITYSTVTGGAVRFNPADFSDVCRTITGNTLNYVRFDIPSSRSGALYYQYNTAQKTGTAVNSTTNYYRSGSSRLLGDVTFAAGSVSGTVTLHYTGTTSSGRNYTGTVEIRVSAPTVNVIRYSGSSTPIPFRASDFQSACQGALGSTLSYIRFNSLPSSGTLNTNYSSLVYPGTAANTATSYYPSDIDQIAYLPKAESQATFTIPYTGYDAQGNSYTSSVEITLSNSYCVCPFTDVAGWDWAKPSIEYLRQRGVTTGYGNNTFGPGRQISRAEFTLMVCRAFQFSTASGSYSFPDVPSGSVYAGAIATARELGIVQGNGGLFRPNSPITRQSAMTMIYRALDAAGESLPVASTALLSAYADGNQVSSHARVPVATLIQMGAVRGTADMRINPTAAISRAEMAVILHRVLTR